MYKGKRVTGVVMAAGSGGRMGLNINKVYLRAGGGLIVEYSLRAFCSHPYVDEVVVAVRPQDQELMVEIVKGYGNIKPVRIVHGGETRNDSVRNAISGLDSDIVLIHDGARPMIRQQYITDCVEAMERVSGAIIAVQTAETVSVRDSDGAVRELSGHVWLAQTPQCFHTKTLLECHRTIPDKSGLTDDASLLERAGYAVKALQGHHSNLKITTPVDVPLAEVYLQQSQT